VFNTFFPTGFFAKNGTKDEKPPEPSRTNSFAVLGDAEAAAEASPAPERKKLQLAPRTVPKEGEEGKATPTEETAPAAISEEAIERSIKNGVAECEFFSLLI
jgi:hypothetical protein